MKLDWNGSPLVLLAWSKGLGLVLSSRVCPVLAGSSRQEGSGMEWKGCDGDRDALARSLGRKNHCACPKSVFPFPQTLQGFRSRWLDWPAHPHGSARDWLAAGDTWGQDCYWFSNENPTIQPEPNNLLTPHHVLDVCFLHFNISSPQYKNVSQTLQQAQLTPPPPQTHTRSGQSISFSAQYYSKKINKATQEFYKINVLPFSYWTISLGWDLFHFNLKKTTTLHLRTSIWKEKKACFSFKKSQN